jgi:hypothetical protein
MPKHQVGAGLTVTGFRDNLDDLYSEFYKNASNDYYSYLEEQNITNQSAEDENAAIEQFLYAEPFTDVMMLMNKNKTLQWTAPRHDLQNGALFFYLSNQAFINARKLFNQAQYDERFTSNPKMMEALRYSFDFIQKYHGHVIGVGRVVGVAESGSGIGFSSRFFADCDNYSTLQNPLPYESLKKYVIVNARSVYTIPGNLAQGLLEEIKQSNTLPRCFHTMKFGDTRYGHLNKTNWLKLISQTHIDISSEFTTSPEETLRFHFFDYLVDFLKDDASDYYTEVTTMRDGYRLGRSDYMVQIHGLWIPFEAKVNTNTEENLFLQLQKCVR